MSTMTTPAQAARQELTGFRGRLIGPGDADYDEARGLRGRGHRAHASPLWFGVPPTLVAGLMPVMTRTDRFASHLDLRSRGRDDQV